jgi:hypothetical protein
MTSAYKGLASAGVAVWLDGLSRPRLLSGDLAMVAGGEIVGITTNPAIFPSRSAPARVTKTSFVSWR